MKQQCNQNQITSKIGVLCLITCSLFMALVPSACSPTPPPTQLILVRHAEKDTSDHGENPPLTNEGLARAQRFLNLYKHKTIRGIYATKYDRNKNTVAPLAEHHSLPIKEYEWHDWQPAIDAMLKTGGTFILCGHGDNLIPIIEYVNGVSPIESLGHYDYQYIFDLNVNEDTTLVNLITF